MSPDMEIRLRQVEVGIATLKNEVDALREIAKHNEGIGERLARIEERMTRLGQDLDRLFDRLREASKEAEEREEKTFKVTQELREKLETSDKSIRRLAVGAVATVSASVLVSAVAIVISRLLGA